MPSSWSGPAEPTSRTGRLRRPGALLRRQVLLHRRGLAALLVALAVLAGLDAVRAPTEATRTTWVAAHDLDGGGLVDVADLRRVAAPKRTVPDGALGGGDLVGRRLAGPMRAGETFTDRRMVGTDLLAGWPGRDAVPVRLADPGLTRLLRTGDRIDLMRVDPQGEEPARLLAPRAVVLAVVSDTGDVSGGAGPSTASSGVPGSGGIVLVAVGADSSPDVAGAGAAGYLTVAIPR